MSTKECDCRRVFLNVVHENSILATIGFGWENLAFYKNWFGTDNIFASRDIISEIKGPVLEAGGYQTRYSKALLDLFRRQVMDEPMFINKLKMHYKMFKDAFR
ncbi:hypothetical protein B2A_12774 [mine drainage metagenome]|uniref:Uncharacterized protein n=1 Tax=mine drainage metagenome TaxID=410659 RepID=T0YM55_9ZZZZ